MIIDLFKEYDKIVGKALEGVYQITKDEDETVIGNIKPNNEDHLFVFNMCHMSAALNDKQFKVRTNWITYLGLKLIYPHYHFKKDMNGHAKAVDCGEFVKVMYNIQPKVGFIALSDIYNAYYRPKKGD